MVQALFDPQVGKEALNPHLAIYADIADEPDPIPLELLKGLQHLSHRCLLILDNCGSELHRKLATCINGGTAPISLVTIEHDIKDDEPENTDVFHLEPASSDIIEKIIQRRYRNLTGPEIRTIASFSEGNFRVALALANTAQKGESLANLNDSELFKRLFQQKNEENPALLRAARVCALVYSFDGEALEGVDAELPILAALAEQSVSEFHGHVAELHRRKLVQKRGKWRAILPHAVAHKLAKQALEDIPRGELAKRFLQVAPERLLKSFSRRLGYLHDSKEAQALVDDWLGESGWIADIGNLNSLGMTVLVNVAPVNPEVVLKSIRAEADRDPDFVKATQNNAEVVNLLRSLAYDAASFEEAVSLIAQFARSKIESNNMGDAINVFKSLFFIVLSGTHASAKQRVQFLRKLAGSNRPEDQQLAIVGLDSMLECGHFMSSYNFEFGTRKRNFGFQPRTRAEQVDWYKSAFSLCIDLSGITAIRHDVRSLIASQFSLLLGAVDTDDLIAVAETFANDGGWPEGWVGVCRGIRIARETNNEGDATKLEGLEQRLRASTLSDRIATYVLPPNWGTRDVAEINLGNDQKYEEACKEVDSICEGIGVELAKDLDALQAFLPQIVRSQSARVFIVASTIGRETVDYARAWRIIQTEVLDPNNGGKIFMFPGAFLAGLSEKDRNAAEKLLDDALASAPLSRFLVHMQLSVGVDSRGCDRLIKACESEDIPTHMFRNLGHGRVIEGLDPADLKRLLLAIANRSDGIGDAIDIFHMHLFSVSSGKRSVNDTERAIGRQLLLKAPFEKDSGVDIHDLTEIVKTCLVPASDGGIARHLCEGLGDAIRAWKVWAWNYGEFISELAILFPRTILDVLVEGGGAGQNSLHGIFEGFGERRLCPLRNIEETVLLDWVHEKPASRFVRVAEVITPWREDAKGRGSASSQTRFAEWTPAALRLIHEAPVPTVVLQKLFRRFYPSGWSGSLADILASRMPLLEQLISDAADRIAKWAGEAVITLEKQIKVERDSEVGRHRTENDRFEW
jgi:hypothetical protein